MVYTKSRYGKQKIGVLLDSLDNSQLTFCFVQQANSLLAHEYYYDISAFTSNPNNPCVTPHFGTFSIADATGHNGILIATNLLNAYSLIKMNTPAKKIFYVWDLEWLRGNMNFLHNSSIYNNPNLTIICRSQNHAEALENYCNRKVDRIISDFNLREIINGYIN